MTDEQDHENHSTPFLHPAAGGLILGADWLLFSGTVSSGGFALPVSVVLGFLSGFIGVTCVQRLVGNDGLGRALLKGLLSGVVVGLPFPIGGTLLGGAVLANSGLDQMRRRAARALVEGRPPSRKPPDSIDKK